MIDWSFGAAKHLLLFSSGRGGGTSAGVVVRLSPLDLAYLR